MYNLESNKVEFSLEMMIHGSTSAVYPQHWELFEVDKIIAVLDSRKQCNGMMLAVTKLIIL